MDLAKVGVQVVAEGVDEANAKLDTVPGHMQGIAESAIKVGQKMSLAITTPLVGLGVKSLFMASSVEESMSKVGVVFGDAKGEIRSFAEGAADAFGMSTASALEASGNWGNLLSSLGADAYAAKIDIAGLAGDLTGLSSEALSTMDPLSAMSESFVALAADISSFSNVDAQQVMEDMQSGLLGNIDPMLKYGVVINETTVAAKALELGLYDANGELSESAKVAARAALIMEGTATAHGDAGETAEGFANSLRRLQAQTSNLMIILGEALLPVMTQLVHWLTKITVSMQNISPAFVKVAVVVGAIVAAIGPLLIVFGTLISAVSTVTAAFGAGGLLAALTPLLLPIAGIIAAIVALGIAYKTNFLGFADAVNYVAGAVRDGLGLVIDLFQRAVEVMSIFRSVGSDPLTASLQTVQYALNKIGLGGLADAFGDAATAMSKFVQRFTKGFDQVTAGFRRILRAFHRGGLSEALDELFGKAGESILRGIGNMIGVVPRLIGDFLKTVETGFAPLDAFLDSVGQVFRDVGYIIQQVFRGDWGGAFENAKNLVRDVVDVIITHFKLLFELFKLIPWDTIGKLLLDGIKGAFDALKGFVSGIDWGALWGDLSSAASQIVSAFGDLAGQVWNWITNAVGNIDWSAIWSTLTDVTATIVSGLGNLVEAIGNWIGDATDIDWSSVWTTLTDITATITEGLGNLVTAIGTWISDATGGIDWTAVWTTLTDITSTIIDGLGDLGEAVGNWISGATGNIDWGTIFADAISAFTSVKDVIGEVGEKATAVGTAVSSAATLIASALSGIWDFVDGPLGSIKDAVFNIGWQTDNIVGTVTSAADSIWGALSGIWDKVSSPLGLVLDAIDKIKSAAEKASEVLATLTFGAVGGGGGSEMQTGSEVTGPNLGGGYDSTGNPLGASAASQLAEMLSTAATSITTSKTTIQTALTEISLAATIFAQTISTQASKAGENFNTDIYVGLRKGQDTLDLVLAAMNTSLGTFVSSIGLFATTAGDDFNTKIYTGLRAGQDTLDLVISAMQTSLGNFVNQVGAFATSAGNKFNTNLSTGLGTAVMSTRIMIDAIQTIMGSLGSQYSEGYNVGYSLGQGINAGMSAWVSAIAATAYAAVAGAVSAARQAAGNPHSPAPATIPIGEALGMGLSFGLSTQLSSFVKSASDFVGAGVEALTSPVHANMSASVTGWNTGSGKSESEGAILQVFALKADEYAKLLDDATQSNAFARELVRDAGIRFPGGTL